MIGLNAWRLASVPLDFGKHDGATFDVFCVVYALAGIERDDFDFGEAQALSVDVFEVSRATAWGQTFGRHVVTLKQEIAVIAFDVFLEVFEAWATHRTTAKAEDA